MWGRSDTASAMFAEQFAELLGDRQEPDERVHTIISAASKEGVAIRNFIAHGDRVPDDEQSAQLLVTPPVGEYVESIQVRDVEAGNPDPGPREAIKKVSFEAYLDHPAKLGIDARDKEILKHIDAVMATVDALEHDWRLTKSVKDFGFLIPREQREGLIGDLLEDIEDMRAQGATERQARWVVIWQLFVVLLQRPLVWGSAIGAWATGMVKSLWS